MISSGHFNYDLNGLQICVLSFCPQMSLDRYSLSVLLCYKMHKKNWKVSFDYVRTVEPVCNDLTFEWGDTLKPYHTYHRRKLFIFRLMHRWDVCASALELNSDDKDFCLPIILALNFTTLSSTPVPSRSDVSHSWSAGRDPAGRGVSRTEIPHSCWRPL